MKRKGYTQNMKGVNKRNKEEGSTKGRNENESMKREKQRKEEK
jgi:hypothetical protein